LVVARRRLRLPQKAGKQSAPSSSANTFPYGSSPLNAFPNSNSCGQEPDIADRPR